MAQMLTMFASDYGLELRLGDNHGYISEQMLPQVCTKWETWVTEVLITIKLDFFAMHFH